MSRAWAKGSTRAWRRRRLQVLNRDRWVCQLCDQPIDRTARHPHPDSATVHHTRGKVYGDELDQLVAAHRRCNIAAGDPTATTDPAPRPMTRW